MPGAVLAPAPSAAGERRHRAADVLIAAALGLAGLIHLALTPEHFAEGPLVGAAFVAMASLQLSVAFGLLRRPGRATYRLALLATVPIVALWAITRLVAAPTLSGPEEVDAWGVAATGLELGAVVPLAAALPSVSGPPRRRWPAAAGARAAFALVFLIASGALGAGPGDPDEPFVDAYTLSGDVSVTIPALAVLVGGGRLFLTLPWTVALFLPLASLLLSAQVHASLGLRACDRRAASRRRGALATLPGLFAAPVCCGAPLLSFLGAGGVVALTGVTPWLLIATCALLGYGTWRVRNDSKELSR